MIETSPPLDWLALYWPQITAWSLFAGLLYKVYRAVQRVLIYIRGLEETRSDINVLMTNHLPHLQAELEDVNNNITGLRSDLNKGLERLSASINVVLARIN